MSTAMELIDQLEGGPEPYLLMEKHVFDGQRERALEIIGLMVRDRMVNATIAGVAVEYWRLEKWRREPNEVETLKGLERVILALGEAWDECASV